MNQPIYSSLKVLMLSFLILVSGSCRKFVEIPLPTDQLTTDFVFTDDNAAIQSVIGIYSNMMNNSQQFSCGFTTFFAGMASDELYYYTPSFRDEFISNEISVTSHGTLENSFWSSYYKYIYAANKCIEEVSTASNLTPAVKTTVIGEAKFVRAFCYYYLANLFGDVPLVINTTYQINQSLPRTPKSTIFTQIINDLKDAQSVLETSYPSIEKVRPNKFAATALLARVYLFLQDWPNAEIQASSVINSGIYSLENDLNSVFLINSNETIWQLRPVNPSRNTWEGNLIIPSSNSATPTYLLTSTLMESFEVNDQRKIAWAQSRVFEGLTLYYPYKYKVMRSPILDEYYVVLRLAEQYLVRAEARAHQNNISGSEDDINIIRNRSGLLNTSANTQPLLLSAIEQERRAELFAEWGHRWFDLKRTNRADAVLGSLKPATWQTTDTLWPIPQTQIDLNPSLIQNPGY